MRYILPVLILINCRLIKVSGVFEWTVIGKVKDYGQNVTLLCNVPNCCPKDSGWDRWTPVQQTLFIDVKTGQPNKKYDGKVLKDGYTLVIQNLTKQDLNVSYSCLYGFTFGKRKFLLEEDVFICTIHCNIPTANSSYSEAKIAGCVVGAVAIVFTISFAAVVVLRRRKNGKNKKQERDEYMEAIKNAQEVRRYVRIQVIGKHKVGKSSLVRRLLEENIDHVESTDGIDIIKKCHIRTSNGDWIVHKDDIEKKELIRRVQNVWSLTEQYENPDDQHILRRQKTQKHLKLTDELTETIESLLWEEKQTYIQKIIAEASDNNSDINKPTITSRDSNEQVPLIDKSRKPMQIPQSSDMSHDNQHLLNLKNYDGKKILENMDEIVLAAKTKRENTRPDLVELGIWDFAGQKDYYATHQTFFTQHAIYVLVADLEDAMKHSKIENKFDSVESYIEFWFDSIHCFCKDTEATNLCPAIFMVFTNIDNIDKFSEEKKTYYETECLTFKNSKNVDHMRGVYYISNTRFNQNDIKEIRNLKKHISKIAKEMNYFADNLSTEWILLENALSVLKESKENIRVLSWDNMEELAGKILIKEKKNLIDFLNNQHKIGNIIFYDDIREYIILNPNWLMECFRCLVCDDKRRDYTLIPKSAWETLATTGEISKESINKLFEKESDLKLEKHKQYLIEIMKKFDIIVKPREWQTKKDSYYMPCMIEQESSVKSIKMQFINENDENVQCTPWLVLEFIFLPIAYFNHILFHYIKCYEVCEVKSDTPAIYKGKAVFYLDKERFSKFIICFSRNAISLQIWNSEDLNNTTNGKEDVDSDMYANVLKELCDNIKNIMKKFNQDVSFSVKAKCSHGNYFKTEGRISYNDLTNKDEYWCTEHNIRHTTQSIEKIWLKHVACATAEYISRKEVESETCATEEFISRKEVESEACATEEYISRQEVESEACATEEYISRKEVESEVCATEEYISRKEVESERVIEEPHQQDQHEVRFELIDESLRQKLEQKLTMDGKILIDLNDPDRVRFTKNEVRTVFQECIDLRTKLEPMVERLAVYKSIPAQQLMDSWIQDVDLSNYKKLFEEDEEPNQQNQHEGLIEHADEMYKTLQQKLTPFGKMVIDLKGPNRPRITLKELRELLLTKNKLATAVIVVEENLMDYQ